jgi:hypothetical protein
MQLLYDLAIILLCIYPKNLNICVYTKPAPIMPVLFLIALKWNKPDVLQQVNVYIPNTTWQ